MQVFSPSKKSSKNRPLNFHVFCVVFAMFTIFSMISGPFWVHSGTPWASFFDAFLRQPVVPIFLIVFLTCFKNLNKTISARNSAPVHRFSPSRRWKIYAQLWKMHRNFHRFFTKNCWKIKANNEKNALCRNNSKKIASWRPFWDQGSILDPFWDPGGNPKIGKKGRPSAGKVVLGVIR